MADVPPVVFKKRANKSANIKKRPATPSAESGSDSDYTGDEGGARVKRRRKEGLKIGVTAPKPAQDLRKSTAYGADRSANITNLENATKQSNWYEGDGDRTVAASRATTTIGDVGVTAADGTYKGASGYGNFLQKNPNAPNRQVGPVKAPTNIRTITVTDFAPDVCKDYKQTGFCGFGDSCKFLHAREDYKQGWQLDKEWESVQKNGKGGKKDPSAPVDELDEDEKMLVNIPFVCIICKQPYKVPVLTKCGHYFCERCAMERYMKERKKSCANCQKDTGGVFKPARGLQKLLDRKKTREDARKESDVEGNGDGGKALTIAA